MYLCMILVKVLFWDILTVDCSFYLEKTTPEAMTHWFQPKPGGNGRQFSWLLYECDITDTEIYLKSINFNGNNAIKCKKIEDANRRKSIYAVGNFICVTDLEILPRNTLEIDGGVYTMERLPEVLSVGINPRAYVPPIFKPAVEDVDLVMEKSFRNLARFFDFTNIPAAKILLRFLSINNIDLFVTRLDPPAVMFSSFAAVMEKIIDRFGYNKGNGSKSNLRMDSKSTPDSQYRPKSGRLFQTTSQSRSMRRSFSATLGKFIPRLLSWRQARSQSKLQPRSRSQSQSPSQFQSRTQPRSPSDPPSPVWDTTPARLQPQLVSPFMLPSATMSEPEKFSLPAAQMSSPPQSSSRSPFRSSTRSPTPSSMPLSSDVLLKIDFMKAVGYMSLKMFDPCFVLNYGNDEKAKAQSYCKLYCQLLGMAIEVYEQIYSDSCSNLRTGQCRDKTCVCEPGAGSMKKYVDMVFCNNELRFYIYEKGWQAFWP